jgi:tetratricopeptide (TPR) repeat protein
MRTMVGALVGLAVASLSLACEEEPVAEAPATPGAAPDSALVGCDHWSPKRCTIAPGKKLAIWVAAEATATLAVTLDGQALEATATTFPDGRRLEVAISGQGDGELSLMVSQVATTAAVSWSLDRAEPPAAWTRATARRSAGDLAGALAALDELPREDAWQARGDGLRARIALMKGQRDRAIEGLRATVARHRRARRYSDEAEDTFALTYLLIEAGRLAEGGLTLAAGREALDSWADARAKRFYHRARLSEAGGDLGAALRGFHEAHSMARRFGMNGLRDDTRLVLAKRMQRLGRPRAAAEHLTGLLEDAAEACRRGAVLNELAWSALLRAEQRPAEPLAPGVAAWLDEALSIFSGACPHAVDHRNALLNRALTALHGDDAKRAAALLDQVASPMPDEAAVWAADLRGRLALARRQPDEAKRFFEASLTRARRGDDREGVWRARVGLARSLEAQGAAKEATRVWREAEDDLDAAGLAVPLGQGRASYLGGRQASASGLVAQLIAQDDVEAAMRAARRARARAIVSMQRLGRIEGLDAVARAALDEAMERYRKVRLELGDALARRWEVAAEALAAHDLRIDALRKRSDAAVAAAFSTLDEPRWDEQRKRLPGEMVLNFFPQPDGRSHWCFVADDDATTVVELAAPNGSSPEALRDALLGPLGDRLAAARSLRVLAHGAWQAIDVHALPWNGRPLLATLPVHYGLDLSGGAQSLVEPAPVQVRTALIVADTRNDLPHARREGAAVGKALSPAWNVRALVGEDATRDAITQALPGAGLLHYAGHGALREDRLASELQLAAEDALTVGDILALKAVPPWVVLSGCATARTRDDAPIADLSLAAAFLAAGAHFVIGTTRPVRDTTGAELAPLLYAQSTDWVPDESLRRAQLALYAQSDDGAAYRFITR